LSERPFAFCGGRSYVERPFLFSGVSRHAIEVGVSALAGGVAFNLTNSNAVTNFNLVNGPSYNQVNGALDPRTAQIGLRFEF
jgi:hypothetical protein